MDLLSIAQKVWRYRLVTIPIVLLTLCGAVYVVAVKAPVYKTTSSYVLINPPAPPTVDQIAADPALGHVQADNPYTRFGDSRTVLEVLAGSMSSQSARRKLLAAGVDPRFTVIPVSSFGFSSPIVQIDAEANSAEGAVRSATVVADAMKEELITMQGSTAAKYQLKVQAVDAPDHADMQASGKLRALVGVLALGAVFLFVIVSLADALTEIRRRRAESDPWDGLGGEAAGPDQLIDLFHERDAQGARAEEAVGSRRSSRNS